MCDGLLRPTSRLQLWFPNRPAAGDNAVATREALPSGSDGRDGIPVRRDRRLPVVDSAAT